MCTVSCTPYVLPHSLWVMRHNPSQHFLGRTFTYSEARHPTHLPSHWTNLLMRCSLSHLIKLYAWCDYFLYLGSKKYLKIIVCVDIDAKLTIQYCGNADCILFIIFLWRPGSTHVLIYYFGKVHLYAETYNPLKFIKLLKILVAELDHWVLSWYLTYFWICVL